MNKPAQTADFFADLRLTGQTTDTVPDDLRPRDLATAYRAQDFLVGRLLAHYGGTMVGYKIACTSPLAQRMLKVDAPVYGQLISSRVYTSPTHLEAGDFTLRGIEAEFAFKMAQDVPTSDVPYTADTIAAFVGAVCPSIEIVDHRLGGWDRLDAFSLIADNAIHGAWVVGPHRRDWRTFDLAAHEVRIIVNGKPKHQGRGANALGHPLNALAWLANALPIQGRQLKRGEHVTTGVCTDVVYLAEAGDAVQADFGVLGEVHITFD
jgi:2-keto-4-pentenoate hydratase